MTGPTLYYCPKVNKILFSIGRPLMISFRAILLYYYDRCYTVPRLVSPATAAALPLPPQSYYNNIITRAS